MGLDSWLNAEQADEEQIAEDILDSWLLQEHFQSLLDANKAKVTPLQQEILDVLNALADDSLNRFQEVQVDPRRRKIRYCDQCGARLPGLAK